jgi:hypothetical protein
MNQLELVLKRQPTPGEYKALQKLREFVLAVDELRTHRRKQFIWDLCNQAKMWLINECWDFERPLEEGRGLKSWY